jgi:hypothetical protein
MVVEFDESVSMNNLWGVPLFGIWLRAIICIPHFFVLAFYAILVGLLQLVTWIPVLIYGRYPGWGYDIVGGFLRWALRVQAYIVLAAAHYPPFSTTASHDVDVDFDRLQDVPRWAGIPIFGLMIRWFILIPHWIIIWALGILVGFLTLVTWIPVLLSGRYAGWAYQLVGGYFRWTYRVVAYMLLMTGPYPPFRLED